MLDEGQGRVAAVEFTGTRPDLLGLLFRGYLLMLPTLGVYRFWVTTWKRRFYWQNTLIDGDALEYTGHAVQLLVGFLFALAFFLPIYIVFFYLSTQSEPMVVVFGYAAVGVTLWFLSGYAIYRGRDFRLSRTLWRGIRFNQHGNAWAYALRRFGWSTLMVLTLGLAYPFMAASLWRYRYGHTWYGDRQCHWTGSWRTIARPFYTVYLIVGGLVAGGVFVGLPIPLTVLAGIVAAGIGWFYFRSREATRMFSSVRLGEASLSVTVRARDLFGQFVVYCISLAAALLALGIASAIIAGLFFGEALFQGGAQSAELARLLQSGWGPAAVMVLGYLSVASCFALLGEVFLDCGYWMAVARGATIANPDSLRSVRATAEDGALVGEGLADALNVGAY